MYIKNPVGYLLILVIACAHVSVVLSKFRKSNNWQRDDPRWYGKKFKNKKRSEKPNIVFLITDDQDVELGSMDFMPQTLKRMRDGGAHFNNAFVTTPMCCPSRSSMLTGMYVHNHMTYTNNDNCSSPFWRENFEIRNFGTYLTNVGYRTGYFGKYLNEYNGEYIPPGWSYWAGLIRNTRFYNYKMRFNDQIIKHENDYHKDYLTDLIANDSVTFLQQSKRQFPNRPVAMVLSMPAPHGPEDAAPQYQELFPNVTTHQTPSFNFAPNPDKQWILQYTGKMEPIHIKFTDMLHRKRLQTLQSVDDAVEKVYRELENLGELENTYFIYSSDHGYHLGQYGLVKGKAMPYEFDIKVPFYMTGPKIPKGVLVPNIVLNIDIAPTLLDIAGVETPEHMDGRSILKLFDGADESDGVVGGTLKRKKAWRDSFLVERGKITHKKIVQRQRMEAQQNNLVETKLDRLEKECQKAEYQPPCGPNQEWVCMPSEKGNIRMFKCRGAEMMGDEPPRSLKPAKRCYCPPNDQPLIDKWEKKKQRNFLKDVVNQPAALKPKFIRQSRDQAFRRRRRRHGFRKDEVSYTDMAKWGRSRRNKRSTYNQFASLGLPSTCRVLANQTVVCEDDVYKNFDIWKSQKDRFDAIIKDLQDRLDKLKDVRKHLRETKPTSASYSLYPEGDTFDDKEYYDEEDYASYEEEVDFEDDMSDNELDMDCDCDRLMDEGDKTSRKGNKKDERRERRRQRKKEKEERRQEREGKRNNKKKDSEEETNVGPHDPNLNPTRDCDSNNMKCFTHDNDHWETPPLWNSSLSKRDVCNREGMECALMDNDHWTVPPYWNNGPFCFCPNSNNNTYWCLRTINETHNFLYCEFITGFISYYDMTTDPYQMRNAVHDLDYATLQIFQGQLERLKACKGHRECTVRTRPLEEDKVPKRRRTSKKEGYDSLNSITSPKWDIIRRG